MSKLFLNAITSFDDLSTETVIYAVYAVSLIVVFIWMLVSLSKSKGLVNHHNAVSLRSLLDFLRTSDNDVNQLNELFNVLTKNKNDISMLFFMYCRIHNSFSSIEYYLNYKTYKKINRKQKPWGFDALVVPVLLISLIFSVSHFIGIQNFFKFNMSFTNFLLAFAFPFGLTIVWLVLRTLIMLKYKMYWVEFENKFRKVSVLAGNFFRSQEPYFEEFSDNILTNISPTGGVLRRIEKIIATTDPDEIESRKLYTSHPQKPKKFSEKPVEPVPSVTSNSPRERESDYPPRDYPPMNYPQNYQQNYPQTTPQGSRVLKPHPETEAYLQAHAQITQQLMQMMMQQSMQQTQIVQRALTSQQALANSVVQQNIMAMRLEAQQTALRRPDFGKLSGDMAAAWASNPFTTNPNFNNRPGEDLKPPQEPEKATNAASAEDIFDGTPENDFQEDEFPAQAEVKITPEKPNPDVVILGKIKAAFELLSPPTKTGKEPDPIFVAPDRDLTNVEERLAQIFSGKVYMYEEN